MAQKREPKTGSIQNFIHSGRKKVHKLEKHFNLTDSQQNRIFYKQIAKIWLASTHLREAFTSEFCL